jgi:hypothetical protein
VPAECLSEETLREVFEWLIVREVGGFGKGKYCRVLTKVGFRVESKCCSQVKIDSLKL